MRHLENYQQKVEYFTVIILITGCEKVIVPDIVAFEFDVQLFLLKLIGMTEDIRSKRNFTTARRLDSNLGEITITDRNLTSCPLLERNTGFSGETVCPFGEESRRINV